MVILSSHIHGYHILASVGAKIRVGIGSANRDGTGGENHNMVNCE